jgi:hypothetical protein
MHRSIFGYMAASIELSFHQSTYVSINRSINRYSDSTVDLQTDESINEQTVIYRHVDRSMTQEIDRFINRGHRGCLILEALEF